MNGVINSVEDFIHNHSNIFVLLAVFSVTVVVMKIIRWYVAGGKCTSLALLNGKTVIITGANTGIGKETAIDLAKRNARVILACRNEEKGKMAVKEVIEKSNNFDVEYRHLDLSSLASVRQFAQEILQEEYPVDILINNAGILAKEHTITEDGFEVMFATNHLGHFLLTNLLLSKLKQAPSARIVIVSALAHEFVKSGIPFDNLNCEKSFSFFRAYSVTKLANVLFTRSLSKRLEGSNITANSLHPGLITTELGRSLPLIARIVSEIFTRPFFKTSKEGAQTTIHCAVSEEVNRVSGKYFSDCKIRPLKPHALNDDQAEKLWKISAEMVGLKKEDYNF